MLAQLNPGTFWKEKTTGLPVYVFSIKTGRYRHYHLVSYIISEQIVIDSHWTIGDWHRHCVELR